MQKILTSYWFWKSELPSDVCDLIVDLGKKETLNEARIGGLRDEENPGIIDYSKRKSNVVFFNAQKYAWIHHILLTYMQKANTNSGWNFIITDQQDPQFTVYDIDNFYEFHTDDDDHRDRMRKLSLSVFLSDPSTYEGGNFEFQNTSIPFKEKGSIIVFPSFLLHRVTPVTSGIRYSLVNWFTGPAFV